MVEFETALALTRFRPIGEVTRSGHLMVYYSMPGALRFKVVRREKFREACPWLLESGSADFCCIYDKRL